MTQTAAAIRRAARRWDALLVLVLACGLAFPPAIAQSAPTADAPGAQTFDSLADVDFPSLARENPLRCLQYLALVDNMERHRQAILLKRQGEVSQWGSLIKARRDVIENGRVRESLATDWWELELAARPDADVYVELNKYGRDITFFCGAVPLISLRSRPHATPETAVGTIKAWHTRALMEGLQETRLDGRPAVKSNHSYEFRVSGIEMFDPKRQFVLLGARQDYAYIVNMDEALPHLLAAYHILPTADPKVKQRAGELAKRVQPNARRVGWSGLVSGAHKKQMVAVFGDLGHLYAHHSFKFRHNFHYIMEAVRCPTYHKLHLLDGDRILGGEHRSLKVVEAALRLIMERRPITRVQTDSLRKLVVTETAPAGFRDARLPEGFRFFVGDTHLHSIYSFDGSRSLANVVAGALASRMEFMVLTDHNTVDGALVLQRLARAYGLSYPTIPGIEVTTNDGHFNAYPVQRTIRWTQPHRISVAQAHEQGAVVQWNHPIDPYSAGTWTLRHIKSRDYLPHGMDAWERSFPGYETMRANGQQPPVIVGASDDHIGAYAHKQRTIIVARDFDVAGRELARAVRGRRVVAHLSAPSGRPYVGDPEWVKALYAALADGTQLREDHKRRIGDMLGNSRLLDLMRVANPGKVGWEYYEPRVPKRK